MRFVNKVFNEVGGGCFILSPSVVTTSWLVACPQALVHGGLRGLGTAGGWLRPFSGPGPGAGMVDGVQGVASQGWWWELELDRGLRLQDNSSCQLHLNRVVVTDCQGLLLLQPEGTLEVIDTS